MRKSQPVPEMQDYFKELPEVLQSQELQFTLQETKWMALASIGAGKRMLFEELWLHSGAHAKPLSLFLCLLSPPATS